MEDLERLTVGLRVWNGCRVLCAMTANASRSPGHSVVDVRGKCVVELGSGCGLLSLVCALEGAERVFCTDVEWIVPWMQSKMASFSCRDRENDARQLDRARQRVHVLPLRWGNSAHLSNLLSSVCAADRIDLVLAADVVYEPEQVSHFATTLVQLARPSVVCFEEHNPESVDRWKCELPRLSESFTVSHLSYPAEFHGLPIHCYHLDPKC